MLNKLGNDLYFFDQVVEGKKKQRNGNPLPTGFLVYSKHKFSTTRTFDNVYFEEQPVVKKRVEFFLENRRWYERKGIPYTLGFLFHGEPGTGKTSEIKAIANVARRHPVNIQLSEIKTKTQLRHLFFSDDIHVFNGQTLEKYTIPVSERVYIIEDADAMGDVLLKREWKKPEVHAAPSKDPFAPELDDDIIRDPIDLAFLLNLLHRRGRRLEAGQLISTGAATGVHDILAGQTAVADFGPDGHIDCLAVPATGAIA
jgi:hypothetical protein